MQFAVDAPRLTQVLLRVVKTPAMHRPHLAAHALDAQVIVLGGNQVAVQKHKVKRRTNPCDRGDDMHPTQQQIDPLQQISFHKGILIGVRSRLINWDLTPIVSIVSRVELPRLLNFLCAKTFLHKATLKSGPFGGAAYQPNEGKVVAQAKA